MCNTTIKVRYYFPILLFWKFKATNVVFIKLFQKKNYENVSSSDSRVFLNKKIIVIRVLDTLEVLKIFFDNPKILHRKFFAFIFFD